ncbi:MAG: phosphoribosylaminoimidazolesuccinocarboxamide synthase [Candidatus Methanofastidiosia archaeon]
MKPQKAGSVKEIYILDDDTLDFVFTDKISVFDKSIPSLIPGKGETLCKEGIFWFNRTKTLGIKTHFLEAVETNRMRVKRVRIIPDYSKIDHNTRNYLIPLEFISRHYVAGSFFDRISGGKLAIEEFGFKKNHKIKYGEKLPCPYIETSTKLEKVDKLLKREEALSISGLTNEEYEEIIDIILKIDKEIENEVSKRGLIHVDGKKEFAFDKERQLMVVDVFGTADEDRFWDRNEWENGRCIELSKEFVRKHYEETGYKDKLYEARRKNTPEPDIPPLPDELIGEASQIYNDLLYRITGGK